MIIYFAGAKDERLESKCLSVCEDTYRRLFSFAYSGDLEKFIELCNQEGGQRADSDTIVSNDTE
jgi:hypothetical protein